jgi:hypothetical protein
MAVSLSACSIYQSDGRKFLEKQAYEFAGVDAQQNLLGCQSGSDSSAGQWTQLSHTQLARVFVHETDDFELRVVPITSDDSAFSCDYGFTSAQEMFEKTPAAVDLTILRLAQYTR